MAYTKILERTIITVCGPDRAKFLQGLISNDTGKASETELLYAMLLTPQGKYFCDMFVWQQGECLFLDCPTQGVQELYKKLNMYKLRSDVTIAISDLQVMASSHKTSDDMTAFVDPRNSDLGYRLYCNSAKASESAEEYEAKRVELGIPEHGLDLIPDKSIPLECHMDKLGAIDWDKGCYMGQELTARTKYRGLVRKCLLPIKFTNRLGSGATITNTDGKKAGEVYSVNGNNGIAMIRIAACDEQLVAQDSNIEVIKPGWLATWLLEKQAELKE